EPIALLEGPNAIVVEVTTANGDVTRYTVDVSRAQGAVNLSSDASLRSLRVNAGVFSDPFSSDWFSYEVSVPFSQRGISITAEANHPAAQIRVAGADTPS